MHFFLAVTIAVSFWHARGVEIPCHPYPVIVAESELPTVPLSWYPGITSTALAATYGEGSPRCGAILISSTLMAYRQIDPPYYCAAIVHEVGHIANLPHTETGIMSPDMGDQIPWGCNHAKRH